MDLQSDLNALGFDAGPVDGQLGAKTQAAVEAYQVSRGLRATGTLDAMQRLALDTEVQRLESDGLETAELHQAEVFEAQSYLRELGYDPGEPDGAWGPRSQAALDAFRRDAGIAVSNAPLAPYDRSALYTRVHGVPAASYANAPGRFGAQPVLANTAPSFNCAGARRASEQAICGNPRLAALDRQVAAAWEQGHRLRQGKPRRCRSKGLGWPDATLAAQTSRA